MNQFLNEEQQNRVIDELVRIHFDELTERVSSGGADVNSNQDLKHDRMV